MVHIKKQKSFKWRVNGSNTFPTQTSSIDDLHTPCWAGDAPKICRNTTHVCTCEMNLPSSVSLYCIDYEWHHGSPRYSRLCDSSPPGISLLLVWWLSPLCSVSEMSLALWDLSLPSFVNSMALASYLAACPAGLPSIFHTAGSLPEVTFDYLLASSKPFRDFSIPSRIKSSSSVGVLVSLDQFSTHFKKSVSHPLLLHEPLLQAN